MLAVFLMGLYALVFVFGLLGCGCAVSVLALTPWKGAASYPALLGRGGWTLSFGGAAMMVWSSILNFEEVMGNHPARPVPDAPALWNHFGFAMVCVGLILVAWSLQKKYAPRRPGRT